MKIFEEIIKLKQNELSLRSFICDYKEAIKNPDVDKYGAEFVNDARIPSFGGNIFFKCYTGNFGNSNVYCFRHFDNDLVMEAFIAVLNQNQERTMQEIADYLRKKIKLLIKDAGEEIKKSIEIFEELKKD